MKNVFSVLILLLFAFALYAQIPVRDGTFHFDGHVNTPIGTNNEDGAAVLVQPDNKIIVAGTQTGHPTFGPQNFALVRYLYNGDLDPSFGNGGIVVSSFESQNYCRNAVLQPDGKIIAVGQSSTGFCIARYLSDGTLDLTFGNAGFTATASPFGSSSLNAATLLADGSILAIGSAQVPYSTNFEVAILKFTPNGVLDTSFGNGGMAFPSLPYTTVTGIKVIPQSSGEIILAGMIRFLNGSTTIRQGYIARLLADGTLDTSFGTNGMVLSNAVLGFTDFTQEVSGKFVGVGNVATNQSGTSGSVAMVRFNADGTPDTSFGTNGSSGAGVNSYAEYAHSVLLQPDGKILLGGSYFDLSGGSVTDCVIFRFLTNGSLDPTFGTGGIYETGVSSSHDRILDMKFDNDYKLVVSGEGNYGSNFDFIAGRILLDTFIIISGILDTNSEVTCAGGADGSITITPTGGSVPYSFLWSNGASTEDISGLTMGSYSCTITDSAGSTGFLGPIVIGEPLTMNFDSFVSNAPSCFGSGNCDGSISVSLSGGTPPYTYLWSDGQITSTAIALCEGTYTVTATDAVGCQETSALLTVDEAPGNLIPLVVSMAASCIGLCDGSITASYSGGTPPYTYLWSDGQTTTTATNLCSGVYYLTGTDANGCQSNITLTVGEPTSIGITLSGTGESTPTAADGQISSTITGGIAPYQYLWDTGAQTPMVSGLTNGTYCLTITDDNGCSEFECTTLMSTSPIEELTFASGIKIYPNPTKGFLRLEVINANLSIHQLSLYSSVGQLVLEENWNGTPISKQFDLSRLPNGVYLLTIETGLGTVCKKVVVY